MKKIAAFVFICSCLYTIARAQDPLFSQFFLNSLDVNPAYAGVANDPRFFLHYRNQWPGAFDKEFATYQVSYDQHIKSISGGLGFNILRDDLFGSALTSTNIDMIYNHRTKINRNFTLQSALQVSFQFENLNTAGLIPVDQASAPISDQMTKPDFAVGFLGRSRYSQIGLSFHHLNTGYLKFNNSFINNSIKNYIFLFKKY